MRIGTDRARRYVGDALHAFERAPVEVTLSVLIAITFSYAVASETEPMRAWLELAIFAVLCAATAFAATLLHALGTWTSRLRWIVTGAGVALAVLYAVFVLDLERTAEGWRAAALVTSALLLVLATPALARGEEDATSRFRLVAGRFVIRVLAVLLYALALFGGLALAIGAVNTLFELHLSSRTYVHVFGWIFFVLVPWAVVGGVPEYVRPAMERGAVAAAVHRLSAFLVPPLLAIYYLILYAYALRIGITGEIPKNVVSPLVIAAGVIAALALVLFDRQEEPVRAVQPLRLAAPLFVPLGLLGLFALNLRLGQYGWTEFRALRTVLLLVLAALATLATVAVVRHRRLRLHIIPIALAVALILAVVGPWNVIAAARRSQQTRLAAALASVGITDSAPVTASTRTPALPVTRDTIIDTARYDDISSTARYLLQHHGAETLPPVLAAAAARDPHADLAHAIGLRRDHISTADARGLYVQLEDGATFTDQQGTRVTVLRLESFRSPERPESVAARADSLTVTFNIEGRSLSADLVPLLRALSVGPERQVLPPDLAAIPVTDPAGQVAGELVVLEVGFGGPGAGRLFRLVGLLRLPAR